MFGLVPTDFAQLTGVTLYLAIFLLPFIQEDAAVIGAATASIMGLAPTSFLVAAIISGLIASDAWKYWIGRLARRYAWAHRFAEKPGVSVAGDLVRKEFIQTMLTARFVPGTRIPTYVACGFFRANYAKYLIVLMLTAALYVAIMFTLFHVGGAVAGEQAKVWLPVTAVALLAAYIAVRWFTHRRGKHGPMTPLTEARDHPLPGMPGFEGTPLEGHDKNESGDAESAMEEEQPSSPTDTQTAGNRTREASGG